MARTDTGTHTPESLMAIASALQAIAGRLTRTAEAMQEKEVAALEVKNQAGLKAGVVALRSFGMAAEEALETWVFDQSVFKESAEPAAEAAKPKTASPGRKQKKQPETQQEQTPG